MRLSFCLAAVKNLRKKKKKKKVGRRRSMIKDATCKDIPEDILMEILVRLPVDSLMRFKCVSKLWSSLITSRYFTNLFFKYSSSTNPKRHVFVHWNHGELYSSSLCNLDATSSFLRINHQGLDLTLLGNRIVNGNCYSYSPLYFVNAIRGLMCFRTERFNQSSVQIINFTTRQRLILPQVETKMKSDDDMVSHSMWNYLGYDPVNDEYKVLSTISKVTKVEEAMTVRSETQVLVLGAGASWRNTKSLITPPPHHPPLRPDEGGISINGVLYYGAFSHENVFVLMSFDFSSEDYNLVKFPEDYNLIKFRFDAHKYIMWEKLLVNLMNYQDQVAVFDRSRLRTECILDLWVLEDAGKSKWSHKFFVLPILELRRTLTANSYIIKGTSRSGEITFCNAFGGEKKINHIIYDLERNQITRVVGLEPLFFIQMYWLEMNIWDDVESIMYLEA